MSDKEKQKRIFGDKLKYYRELAQISQDELAKACGYKSRSSINKIELGSNDMPRKKVALAAHCLGISPSLLFLEDSEIVKENLTTSIVNKINRLDETDLRVTEKVIDGLLENDKYKKDTPTIAVS